MSKESTERVLTISTQFNADVIEQMVDFHDPALYQPITEQLSKQVLRLREEGVKFALRSIGWMEPEVASALVLAATDLRQAQREYMNDRGNNAKGARVAVCAAHLDIVLDQIKRGKEKNEKQR